MPPKIQIYTWSNCPFCVRSKNLLKQKGVSFEEIDLDGKDDELKALRDRTGMRTVPQIFFDDELIGGFSELSALDQSGELDRRLGRG